MKYLKKFEELDFSQTLPLTTREQLTMYYSCDDCDDLWKSANEQCDICPTCKSKNIEELSEDEFYEIGKEMSDEEDSPLIDKLKKSEQDEIIDLTGLIGKNDKRNYVN